MSWPRFRRRSVTSRTKSCVHTRLPLRWHDLETFLLHRVEHVLAPRASRLFKCHTWTRLPGVETRWSQYAECNAPSAFVPNPSTHTDLHSGLWRTGRLCAATMPCNTFHLSLFTNHGAGRSLALPGLPYALAADNFCTSSLVSFTSAKRNKGLSCSGVRALAMGATTVG